MVLKAFRLTVVVIACMWLTGCVSTQNVVRARTQTPVVSVFLMEYPDRRDVDGVPGSFVERVQLQLAQRNLVVESVGSVAMLQTFQARRSTEQRVADVVAAHPDKTVMLVESEVRFYSYLSGKYRWNVQGRVTMVQPDGVQQSSPFELSAFLDYEHQRESEALQYVEVAVSERVGQAADRFLSGMGPERVELPQ